MGAGTAVHNRWIKCCSFNGPPSSRRMAGLPQAHRRALCSAWSRKHPRRSWLVQSAEAGKLPDSSAARERWQNQADTAEPPQAHQHETTEHSTSQTQQRRQQQHPLLSDAGLLRRLTALQSANQALDMLLAEADRSLYACSSGISEEACRALIQASLEQGNASLAQSIHSALCQAPRLSGSTSSTSSSPEEDPLWSALWPPASIETTAALVLGLAKALRLNDAISAVEDVRKRGVPRGDEVPFGHVVNSPLPPQAPLAVVQPQEGSQVVADSNTRYEFELWSGRVVSNSSEAVSAGQNWLLSAARAVGLWRRPAVAAVHQMDVQAPDGRSRTFRFATDSADVPAQVNERVTVVCAPGARQLPGSSRGGPRSLLPPRPPSSRPGQPLAVANHATGAQQTLLPPPASSTGLPGWLLPAAVLVAGSDAAAAIIDPALPGLMTAGLVTAAASGVLGTTLVLPRLKQLPESAVRVESMRQKLLGQHEMLVRNIDGLVRDASEDVRVIARLWQLQNKMQSVGQVGVYDARIERVAAARGGLEERLVKKLGLIDGYARVLNMIEIEVEMDSEVAAAEIVDIEQQIERLSSLQELQAEWQYQAEAQDEVERLLKAA